MSHPRIEACPACGHRVAVPFFDGGAQPLATIAWPASAAEARAMSRLALEFVQCVRCSHIFNVAFDYAHVPYSSKPNLMFNRGTTWSQFIRNLQARIVASLPAAPVVVEVGHGDASFLIALADLAPKGRYIGFDPNGAADGAGNVELRTELFEPARHLADLQPDLLVSRHVLEHLESPLGFLQAVAFSARRGAGPVRVYFEVPCADRLQETNRTVDLYYEHSSQFTTRSFTAMLDASGARDAQIGHAYDREVLYAFATLHAQDGEAATAAQSERYRRAAAASLEVIGAQLAELAAGAGSVAIWGGTGKSAAFMARYGCDAARFPVVVDSDRSKAGTFVPGTGQEIRFRDWLKGNPVHTVIIPPQWRAADIVREMRNEGIDPVQVLIEHDGRLVDFLAGEHPYQRP